MCVFFILLVGCALFVRSTKYVPTDIDDLLVFSSVSAEEHPLSYFWGDVGLGKNEFRPLHAVSVWTTYRLVGPNAAVHQWLNLLVHFANAVLALTLLNASGAPRALACFLACLFLVSIYSVSPASWISDRPALLVGTMLLVLLIHIMGVLGGRYELSPWLLLGTALGGLLSKESGLLLVVLVAVLPFIMPEARRHRLPLVVGGVALLAAYALWRTALFGANAVEYRESGVMLWSTRYDSLAELLPGMRALAMIENVIKTLLAPLMPIFDNKGAFFIGTPMIGWATLVIVTPIVVWLGLRRPWNSAQRVALVLWGTNAVIHAQVFRHRTQYVGMIALLLFLGGSAALRRDAGRLNLALVLGAALLLANVLISSSLLENGAERRLRLLGQPNLGITAERYGRFVARIDSSVTGSIQRRYRHILE
jgi:hypothetical protein